MWPKGKPKKGFQTYATYVEEFERAMKKDNIPVINFVNKGELKTVFETNSLPSTSKDKYLKETKTLEKIDKNPDVKTTCKESSKKSNKSKTDKNAYLKEVTGQKNECAPLTISQNRNSKDSKRSQKLDKNTKSVREVTAKSFLKVNSQPKTSKNRNSKESNENFLNKFVSGYKTEKAITKISPPNVFYEKLQEIDKNSVPTSLSDVKVILETNSEPNKCGKSKMDSYNDDNIRIISKFFLYEDLSLCDDPDMEELVQNTSEYYSYPNYRNNDTAGFDWTSRMWLKSGMQPSGKMRKPMKIRLSNDQKDILDALKTPVKLSKAESMMRKMGWNGGALGKNGLGIVAPIIPNLAYTRSTMGFGHATTETNKERKVKKPPKPSSKVVVRRERKRLFHVNVLFVLLDFIRNDSELEIGFDERLSKTERRAVHMLVQSLFEDDVSLKNYDSNEDLELISIVKKNCTYIMLGTHSVGDGPNRQLYIYKEAPDHIYLVVPNDLIPDEINDNKPKVIQKPKIEEKENKSIDFSIFKKPIGQPSLGELIAKVYKEHDESEAKSSREINAELKTEDTGRDISVKSGEMSAEFNSENKKIETVISSEEMNSELNSENKERITAISSEEMNSELNSKNKERIKAICSEEMNSALTAENKERITEISSEEMNSKLNSDNKERIKAISSKEINSELNLENKDRKTAVTFDEISTGYNLENKKCDKSVNSSEISADLNLKTKENIDEIEMKRKVTKQSAVNNECVKEFSEENCIKTNTNMKIIEKDIVGEVNTEINFENALEKQNIDKMAAEINGKDEKSEINIENNVNSDVPFAIRKLTDYFLEFYEDDYREMRFLGPFDVEQIDFINGFIENVQWCIKNGENAKNLFVYRNQDVYKAMTSDAFHFDINEDDKSLVIHKLEKTK